MNASPLLEAKRLRLSFGGVRAADDVNLTVSAGEMLAIIGQNGAGKSTFLNICTGHLRPESGEVRFAGRSIIGYKPRAIARMGIARAFQHPQVFFRQSVRDNLRFALAAGHNSFWHPLRGLASVRPQEDVVTLLELCDLGAVASLPARGVPEGARKLLDVAMALALSPRLLFLDEPTSGVSSSEKLTLMTRLVAALTARGVTAIFVEHDMEVVAQFAKRVAVWTEGRLFRVGPPEDILNDPEVRARVL